MTLKKPKPQPTGYVFNDPQDGTIFIGKDPDSKRPRQIELTSQSLGCIRLFGDGGFDIRSNSSAQKKDNIISNSKDGLGIYSNGKGIHIDAGNGELTITARSIVINATGSDEGGVTIRSNQNIDLDAADHVKIEGSNVAIASRNKLLLTSKGFLNIRGIGGVLITEPKQTLLPTSIGSVITQTFSSILPGFF
jgi:hypothetical protein